MDPRRVLTALRRGDPWDEDDLRAFARGLADGSVSDAQGAAFAMGVCRSEPSPAETASLTRAMRDSGEVLHWDLPGPVLDKHSTGGLGDATSLVLAPVLAAMGAYAPFLSGRGLGHTGGTLDKLEAIEGVRTDIGGDALRQILAKVGCAVVGASRAVAPADRVLYALRDHTATVQSPALITASILSKKLAAGAGAILLDVKGGTGAFMQTRAEARGLAELLVATTREIGTPVRALITDMNQPLAPAVGNAVEIREVLAVLTDPKPDQRLCRLTLALAGELAQLGGLAGTAEEGGRRALEVLHDGSAAGRFAAMVHAMGGPSNVIDSPHKWLPEARVILPVHPVISGHVAAIDGVALGDVVVGLGGGRKRPGDAIDHSVGLSDVAGLGDAVGPDAPLALVHAAREPDAQDAAEAVRAAFQIGQAAASAPPLIHERIG